MSAEYKLLKSGLIPEDWKNDIEYEDIQYVEYHLTAGPHCDQARTYRDVTGATVYACRHNKQDGS